LFCQIDDLGCVAITHFAQHRDSPRGRPLGPQRPCF